MKIIVLSFLALTLIGCKKQEKGNLKKSEILQSEKRPNSLISWVHAVNGKNIQSINSSYDANAVKIISSDSLIQSAAEMVDYYTIKENKITSIESLFSIVANQNRGIHYELVRYKTDDLKEYIEIVIWRVQGQHRIREFEFTQESTSNSFQTDTTKIAARRKLWVELCNANNAENLVKELYSTNTMYFNHKPIVTGIEALIKEYGYMNNKDYSLNLNPLKLEIVNTNFAFEIGKCSGSYNGKYILVWKKEADGDWKIYIDSNI